MKWAIGWRWILWPRLFRSFFKGADCAVCAFTIFGIAVHHYCLQTAYRWSTFRSGSGTAILQRRQTSMPTLITVLKSPRHRQWKQGLNYLKAVILQASGRLPIEVNNEEKNIGAKRTLLRYGGGDEEIWTLAPGNSRPTAFRVRTLQPLGYISVYFCLLLTQKIFGEKSRREHWKIFDF